MHDGLAHCMHSKDPEKNTVLYLFTVHLFVVNTTLVLLTVFGCPSFSHFRHRAIGSVLELSFPSRTSSKGPEMQVEVLGLQSMYGGGRRGSEPRKRRGRSGQDVIDAKLDLRFWFVILVGLVWVELDLWLSGSVAGGQRARG